MGRLRQYTSIMTGSDGFGLIAYRDLGNLDLKVAHLSSLIGIPHRRGR
jgi:hypothetical protein